MFQFSIYQMSYSTLFSICHNSRVSPLQTLAMIALWAGATYLAKFGSKNASFIAAVPATFMSAVSCTYIMMAGEGLGLSASISYPVGIVFAVAMLGIFLFKCILKSDTKTA